MTGVLAEHDPGGPQLLQHTQRDVLEIPDRRRADRERHYSRASQATKPAPISPAAEASSAGTISTRLRPGSSDSRVATSRAGSSRYCQAAAPKPPPITTRSGLNRF